MVFSTVFDGVSWCFGGYSIILFWCCFLVSEMFSRVYYGVFYFLMDYLLVLCVLEVEEPLAVCLKAVLAQWLAEGIFRVHSFVV